MDYLVCFINQFLPFYVCVFSVSVCFFLGVFWVPLSRFKIDGDSDVTRDAEAEESCEEKETAFCFSFRFPTYEEFCLERNENRGGMNHMNQSENRGNEEDEDLEDEWLEMDNHNEEGEEKVQQLLLSDEEAEVCSMECPFEMESDSNSDSSSSIPVPPFHVDPIMAIYGDGFLSDREFEFEPETPIYVEGDYTATPSSSSSSSEELLHPGDSMEKQGKSEFLTDDDFSGEKDDIEEEEEDKKESTDKLEPLWEHQDLIEQLEMEMKKARATGLPTILEDSECPKIMEDLKPWRISERYEHGGDHRMGELHRFYKSYKQRMRKLDILNFQKMYAIGFMRFKDPLKQIRVQGSYVRAMGALLLNKIRSDNSKTESTRFMKELQDDIEVVYVGQMCLSWEFLCWQYMRELENQRSNHKYDNVTRDFQQFCVLLQRFMEDEMVDGPRIHCYVKTRRILRNLLQVPLAREDYSCERRNRTKMRKTNDKDIGSKTLVEIMGESIKTFWDFLKADKDSVVYSQKGPKEIRFESKDLDLFMKIRRDLYKKDKHVRDVLQNERRISSKMFGRNHEEIVNDFDRNMFFLAQIEMRLVSRILNMCKLTHERLVWCQNKINRINLMGRRIHLEHSFLLFPC